MTRQVSLAPESAVSSVKLPVLGAKLALLGAKLAIFDAKLIVANELLCASVRESVVR